MFLMHELEQTYCVTHLINIAYYYMPPDYTSLGELHDFWELVYVDKGEIIVQAESTDYLLKAGELAFHRPNEYHNVRIYDNKPANLIIIAFHCDSQAMAFFENRIAFLEQREKQCLRIIVKEAESTYQFFENQSGYVNLVKTNTAAFGAEQIIRANLELLLIYMRRRDRGIGIESRGLQNRLHNSAELAEHVRTYLRAHLSEKITLDSLASALNISVSQIKRIFKEQTSTTVIAYLTKLRITTAKRLIREHDMNFTQIAEAVGYDNICYFSSQFKRQTGMTPTEYSRSMRE